MDSLARQQQRTGQLYDPRDAQLQAAQAANQRWLQRYNACPVVADEERLALLREGLAKVGAGSFVRAPFHCDYGHNIRLGAGVFINFNVVILDVAPVSIGDLTQIGPGAQLLTADHPRDARQRADGLERGLPISVGRNVWIGAGALVLPGVTIGDDAVVGAGSVVTRDVPAGCTVVGNPARLVSSPG
ncbi:MAG: sugar O-acetyltransferase [Gammaproteobacteria bacterium]|nr:sugar O-acetyltransferase [Gammaproteobacteria bacterium]MBU1491796.1 sugar O-acetyltransferase [Gammaproteobacteria bacterium]MBU2064526.1 sugar O-acetyltransferase [Gammaproteobacteria bacterium]MBU2138713.1 sugar O-acetyltransferase [Gammaproteobacteria bacterium]MBU2214910.1 sugar O-acetyltransferase [Gammaproteobacteria bacterium]